MRLLCLSILAWHATAAAQPWVDPDPARITARFEAWHRDEVHCADLGIVCAHRIDAGELMLADWRGHPLRTITASTRISSIALSPLGRWLAVGHAMGWTVYDLFTGAVRGDWHVPSGVSVGGMAISPDGSRLVATLHDGALEFATDGAAITRRGVGVFYALSRYRGDGEIELSRGSGDWKLWPRQALETRRVAVSDAPIEVVRGAPESRWLAAVDGRNRLWFVGDDARPVEISGVRAPDLLTWMARKGAPPVLIVGDAAGGIWRWEPGMAHPERVVQRPGAALLAAHEGYVAAADQHRVDVFSLADGKCVGRIEAEWDIDQLEVRDPDGRSWAFTALDDLGRVWMEPFDAVGEDAVAALGDMFGDTTGGLQPPLEPAAPRSAPPPPPAPSVPPTDGVAVTRGGAWRPPDPPGEPPEALGTPIEGPPPEPDWNAHIAWDPRIGEDGRSLEAGFGMIVYHRFAADRRLTVPGAPVRRGRRVVMHAGDDAGGITEWSFVHLP